MSNSRATYFTTYTPVMVHTTVTTSGVSDSAKIDRSLTTDAERKRSPKCPKYSEGKDENNNMVSGDRVPEAFIKLKRPVEQMNYRRHVTEIEKGKSVADLENLEKKCS